MVWEGRWVAALAARLEATFCGCTAVGMMCLVTLDERGKKGKRDRKSKGRAIEGKCMDEKENRLYQGKVQSIIMEA